MEAQTDKHTARTNSAISTINSKGTKNALHALFVSALSLIIMGAFLAPITIPTAANTAAAVSQQALQALPSYANPLTGVIEDSGQNPELGQGMAENLILRTPAEMLIDAEDNIFITFRVGLVEESQDLIIQLLDADGNPDRTLPYSIVENLPDLNARDIRINVPDEHPVLRISLVSIPMGREVVCFASFALEGAEVDTPIAEITSEVDDTAIVIQEAGDEPIGIADEDRVTLLHFLGLAGGIVVGLALVAVVAAVVKKKKAAGK